MNKSCLIIAGEKSGEEHAMSFFPKLKASNPDVNFFGVGGSELKNSGLEVLFHLNDFSSWGYTEVITKIPFYKKAMDALVEEAIKRDTKVAILIDFQSFNMKLAKRLKEIGIEVLYYVAPQAWAWKEYRVKKLAATVHTLFTIIPFEKEWFLARGLKRVIGIEHPQLTLHKKEILSFKRSDFSKNEIKLLLLPGSRNFEVEQLLNEFVKAIELFKSELNSSELNTKVKLTVSIVKSSSVKSELYTSFEKYFDKVYFNEDLVFALKGADFALAASGTVTLSCALFELPTIVCYRTSMLNYFIYETFVSYRGPVSLANIVHNRTVFPELLQDSTTAFNIASNLKLWYDNQEDYKKTRTLLASTKELVKGEDIDIPEYMSSVIKNSYGKKAQFNS